MIEINDLEKEDRFSSYDRQILQLIFTKIKELFLGFRLLYIHIFLFFIGIILLYLLIRIGSKPLATASILSGICLGFIYGIVTVWHLSRNIVGNLYYRAPLSLKKGIFVLIIAILISNISTFTHKLLKGAYYKYILLPAVFAIPIGELIVIAWLIKYEKIHGEVYVVQRKK